MTKYFSIIALFFSVNAFALNPADCVGVCADEVDSSEYTQEHALHDFHIIMAKMDRLSKAMIEAAEEIR